MRRFPNNGFFRRASLISGHLYIYISTAYAFAYQPDIPEWTVKLVLGGNVIFAAIIGFYHKNREADDRRADILYARGKDDPDGN